MRRPTRLLVVLFAAAATVLSAPAAAQVRHGHRPGPAYHAAHGHYSPHAGVRFGLFVGAPLWYGWPGYYYAPPYHYYAPGFVTVPPSPQTYIEQAPPAQAAPAAPQPGYWYYCADARAYYPYVKECPAGWQRVSPQPPAG